MRATRLLCNAAATLVPAAASFYVALRANITLMIVLSAGAPQTTSEEYALRLLDVVSLIVLLMAWLAVTIWLHARVSRAKTCTRALRVGSQHTGISLLALGVLGALFRLAVPQTPGGLLVGLVAVATWAGGIALVTFGFQRGDRDRGSAHY